MTVNFCRRINRTFCTSFSSRNGKYFAPGVRKCINRLLATELESRMVHTLTVAGGYLFLLRHHLSSLSEMRSILNLPSQLTYKVQHSPGVWISQNFLMSLFEIEAEGRSEMWDTFCLSNFFWHRILWQEAYLKGNTNTLGQVNEVEEPKIVFMSWDGSKQLLFFCRKKAY